MIDNTVVHNIIQDALDNHSMISPDNFRAARSLQNRLHNALRWVILQRNRGQCDENWAAADHYLDRRATVLSGQAVMISSIQAWGYDGVKLLFDGAGSIAHHLHRLSSVVTRENVPVDAIPGRQRLSEGRCPVTPPSLEALRWAEAGIADGEQDRSNLNFTRRLIAPTL